MPGGTTAEIPAVMISGRVEQVKPQWVRERVKGTHALDLEIYKAKEGAHKQREEKKEEMKEVSRPVVVS